MSTAELLKRVEKMNKRVTHEWDVFMSEHGSNWDEMSEESRRKACELAEMIAERWVTLTNE